MNRPSARDLAPGPRFILFAILSLLLMYFDQKDDWGDRIRYGLQAVAYPIQVAIGSPRKLWSSTSEFFRSRATLREQNEALRERERELSLRSLRLEALERENERLRGLDGAFAQLITASQLVNVVSTDLGHQRHRVVIDEGRNADLYRSQPIVDAAGLVGQLIRVGPWSGEVMLISDREAAVPVEVARSGLRSIAVGTNREDELELPLIPASADIQPGDLLVTSGLGGVFPAGIPVGTVTEVLRDPDELLATVHARPVAQLSSGRQLLALWFDPVNPAAPVDPKLLENLPEPSVAQPVTAPPRQPATRRPGPR